MRLEAKWERPSRSLALRQSENREGWLIGLTDRGRYIIQAGAGEAEIDVEEARLIALQLRREPAIEDSPWIAFDDPDMDAYVRDLDAS